MVTYASERTGAPAQAHSNALFCTQNNKHPISSERECGSSPSHVSHAHTLKHNTRLRIYIQFAWPPSGMSKLTFILWDSKLTQNKSVSFYSLFFIFIFALFWLPLILSFLSHTWLILSYPRAQFPSASAKPKHFVWKRQCEWVCASNAELNLRSFVR